ncbi:WG repeat-containing protein [Persicobacter sp. CCB-QB2]|uniref:WG repeat-containing protein n=1 Tax=Persicobacter sp. CCB-QB2 TaxID=1561025 RepID=UPI0006A9A7FA|nr:WG repeat-containing protein [Persicobacter sp. CCB-QB2]
MKNYNYLLIICFLLAPLGLQAQEKFIPFSINGIWGYHNQEGKEVITPQFQDAKAANENGFIVAKSYAEGDLYGFISPKQETIIPFVYEKLYYVGTNLLVGQQGKVYTLLNEQGQALMEINGEESKLLHDDGQTNQLISLNESLWRTHYLHYPSGNTFDVLETKYYHQKNDKESEQYSDRKKNGIILYHAQNRKRRLQQFFDQQFQQVLKKPINNDCDIIYPKLPTEKWLFWSRWDKELYDINGERLLADEKISQIGYHKKLDIYEISFQSGKPTEFWNTDQECIWTDKKGYEISKNALIHELDNKEYELVSLSDQQPITPHTFHHIEFWDDVFYCAKEIGEDSIHLVVLTPEKNGKFRELQNLKTSKTAERQDPPISELLKCETLKVFLNQTFPSEMIIKKLIAENEGLDSIAFNQKLFPYEGKEAYKRQVITEIYASTGYLEKADEALYTFSLEQQYQILIDSNFQIKEVTVDRYIQGHTVSTDNQWLIKYDQKTAAIIRLPLLHNLDQQFYDQLYKRPYVKETSTYLEIKEMKGKSGIQDYLQQKFIIPAEYDSIAIKSDCFPLLGIGWKKDKAYFLFEEELPPFETSASVAQALLNKYARWDKSDALDYLNFGSNVLIRKEAKMALFENYAMLYEDPPIPNYWVLSRKDEEGQTTYAIINDKLEILMEGLDQVTKAPFPFPHLIGVINQHFLYSPL